MARSPSGWRRRRVKHRDAVALCILSSAFLLAGAITGPLLQDILFKYILPVLDRPPLLLLNLVLISFAFTNAFGAVLVFLGGWYFMRGKIPRGRFFVGLGIGLTSLSLASRVAYSILVEGSAWTILVPLVTSLTGIGVLLGVAAHTLMGQYALLVKKHALRAWRRRKRARRGAQRGARS